jgi:hypothetical protein
MDAAATAHCSYARLENGIHRFEITENTRQGVDEFFGLRRKLQDELVEKETMLLVYLSMAHLPSISYIMNHVVKLAQDYPRIQPTYTAIIYRRGMLVFVLNNFLKVFLRSKDRVRFFAEDEADKAVEWLMKRD